MRACDYCGKQYQPKLSTSKYCKPSCRVSASKRRKAGLPIPVRALEPTPAPPGRLAEVTRAELGTFADTSDGVLLLALAERIDTGAETSQALASLSKEYAARKADMLTRVAPKADPLDELAAARERRRSG